MSAILILAISIPAFLYADSWGRRTSVIAGGTGLSTCMFIIGCLYASDNVHAIGGAGRWFVVVLIFAFALIYAATWAIVGKIYASEVQPAQTRAAANSLAQGLNFVRRLQQAHAIGDSINTDVGIIIVYKLACSLCNPYLPRSVLVRCLLSLRRSLSVHGHSASNIHAGDTRSIPRVDPRQLP